MKLYFQGNKDTVEGRKERKEIMIHTEDVSWTKHRIELVAAPLLLKSHTLPGSGAVWGDNRVGETTAFMSTCICSLPSYSNSSLIFRATISLLTNKSICLRALRWRDLQIWRKEKLTPQRKKKYNIPILNTINFVEENKMLQTLVVPLFIPFSLYVNHEF